MICLKHRWNSWQSGQFQYLPCSDSCLEKVPVSPWLVTLLHICGVIPTPQSPISLETPREFRYCRALMIPFLTPSWMETRVTLFLEDNFRRGSDYREWQNILACKYIAPTGIEDNTPLTACKKTKHTLSPWYRIVYITWLVVSYDTHKGKH